MIIFSLGSVGGESKTIQLNGGASDGDKLLCLDSLFHDVINDNCLIYSFGIADDWTFEISMAELGCQVCHLKFSGTYLESYKTRYVVSTLRFLCRYVRLTRQSTILNILF